jgi:hypothetical protein
VSSALQEASGLIRDLATLQPELFSLEEGLIEALSDHADASLSILSPRQQVELVVALSALLFSEDSALIEGGVTEVSTSSAVKKGSRSTLTRLYNKLLVRGLALASCNLHPATSNFFMS